MQMDLHAYYMLTKDLTNEQLIVHREAVTKKSPSLPHRAGKASKALDAATERLSQLPKPALALRPAPRKGKRGPVSIRVTSLVRPEIDAKKLANALLRVAKEMEKASDKTQSEK